VVTGALFVKFFKTWCLLAKRFVPPALLYLKCFFELPVLLIQHLLSWLTSVCATARTSIIGTTAHDIANRRTSVRLSQKIIQVFRQNDYTTTTAPCA
jgi:hypothetical protein